MNAAPASTGAVTVALPKRIDSMTASSVEALVIDAVKPGGKVIVDGYDVEYMSAAGVRALATVLHYAERHRGRLVFCRFGGAAAECLAVSGFAQLLDIAESHEAAVARLLVLEVGERSERLPPRGPTG